MSVRFFSQAASVVLALVISLSALNLSRHSGPIVQAQSALAASIGGCPLFPANTIWNRDISALPAAGTPTPTGQPSPTASATAGTPSATPGSSQAAETSGGAPNSGQAGNSSANIRMLLVLVLGGLGILLLVVLGIWRRLQEAKRLAAEAQQNQDTQPPP